ncbi:MAG: hypothetical protein HUU01_24280 [Saprospiraceae bacterium]|nr:hypothetical protein [Saprospiraceae bacterium]
MELTCPNCNSVIDADNINVMTDLAKCTHCGSLHKASTLASFGMGKPDEFPPRGSKISLNRETGDIVSIVLPAKGFRWSSIPLLLFTIFWLGFISLWTTLASQAGFFALFSIPFWIAGFFMLAGLIISIAEKQVIKIGRGQIILIKSRPFFSKELKFNFSEIQEISLKSSQSIFSYSPQAWRLQNRYAPLPETPAVITGAGTRLFFEGANDAEKSWVVKYLMYKIASVKR